jgi:hypothetical protein
LFFIWRASTSLSLNTAIPKRFRADIFFIICNQKMDILTKMVNCRNIWMIKPIYIFNMSRLQDRSWSFGNPGLISRCLQNPGHLTTDIERKHHDDIFEDSPGESP